MMLHRYLPAALICGSLLSGPANSQTVCDKRAAIVQQLRERYQEQRTAMGLLNDGAVVELFTSAEGSFSILVTTSFGLSCVTLFGGEWERKDGKVFDFELQRPPRVH